MANISDIAERTNDDTAEIAAPTASKTNSARRGLLWLIGAAFIWGTVGVSSALLNRVEQTPPLTVGFLRLAFSSPFLLGLAWVMNRSNPLRVGRRNLPLFGGMGLAMASYQLFYFAAIPISSVTLVVVIALCSAPLIVALLSIFIFHEKLTRTLIIALLLGLAGTGLLAFGGDSGSGEFFKPEYLLGALLALGAGFSYSWLAILSRIAAKRSSETSSTQTLAISFTFAAIILLVIAIPTGNLRLNLAPGVWAIAAYLGIVPTGLAYIIFLYALKSASATAASITTLLEPAVAAFLAWLILGEKISLLTVTGGALLLVSVWLLSKPNKG